MAKIPTFLSFHYDNDAMRVQQVRNIGVIEGNAALSSNDWETVKRGGEKAIKAWIDATMNYKRCVIVMIGAETANRYWVNYEIEKAWRDKRGLFGIYIHNLKDPRKGISSQGRNPFDYVNVGGQRLSQLVPCYNPSPRDAYNDIAANITSWVASAV